MYQHRSSSFTYIAAVLFALPSCSGQGTVLQSRPKPHEGGSGGSPPSDSPDSGIPVNGEGSDASAIKAVLPLSGSQVKAVGWAAGGTIFTLKEYRDTKHDVTCALQTAEDGVSRCLPGDTGVSFLDSDCKQPVVQVDPPVCPPAEMPRYGIYRETPPGQCGLRAHVVSVGKAIATPREVYELSGEPTTCLLSRGGTPIASFYEAIPTAPSDWVAYQSEVVPLSSDVGVEQWHGEDGSRIVGGFQILRGKLACSPLVQDTEVIGNFPRYCVPSARAGDATSYFADGTCTDFVTGGSRCEPPVLAVRAQNDYCALPHLAELGKERTPESLFWQVPGELRQLTRAEAPCEAIPAGVLEVENARYFEIGPEINPARYPALSEAWIGTGPILGARWTGTSGSTLFKSPRSADGMDARAGQPCNITQGPEKAFCTHSIGQGSYAHIFADSKCTQPLFAFDPKGECNSNLHKPRWTIPSQDDGCPPVDPTNSLRPVLDLHRGPIYSRDSVTGSPCLPLDPSANLSPYQTYDLGDPIDPASVFTQVTELDY